MHDYELTGDPYEMGQENARLLHRSGYTPRPATEEQVRFAEACAVVVEKHAPWLLEEIQGVAATGLYDPCVVKVLPLTLYADPGCTVIAVSAQRSHTRTPLFGRNYDFLASFHRFNSLYRTRPRGYLAHIGCSDQWVGRHDGMNEAGLAIGHSGPPPDERRPGFVITLAIRAVLDTCRTVMEAQAFLESIPHLGNTCYLVADATDDIAAIEVNPRRVVTTRFPSGIGFLANQYVSTEMAADSSEEVRGSTPRIRNLEHWATAHAEVQLEDVRQILADPIDGVCAALPGTDVGVEDPVVTLWSWVAALDRPALLLARGTPNETAYETAAL